MGISTTAPATLEMYQLLFETTQLAARVLTKDRQVVFFTHAYPLIHSSKLDDTLFDQLFQPENPLPVMKVIGGLELYACFPITVESQHGFLLLGPNLLFSPWSPEQREGLTFGKGASKQEIDNLVLTLPPMTYPRFSSYVRLLYLALHQVLLPHEALDWDSVLQSSQADIDRRMGIRTFERRELQDSVNTYHMEQVFLECVEGGLLERLEWLIDKGTKSLPWNPFHEPEIGSMYAFAAEVALVSRSAIKGGMEEDTAHSLCTLYLKQAEQLENEKRLLLRVQMLLDFTRRVHKQKRAYPPPIFKAMDFIDEHLHENIRLKDIAKAADRNAEYLCTIFQKSTGESLTWYIQKKRVEEARNLLQFSDYSYAEISSYLAFSSQSYFISVFKRHTGITPAQYRQKHFCPQWI